MNVLVQRSREILTRPQAVQLLVVALGAGAVSSAAAAYLVLHIDPKADVRRELWSGIALGTVATLGGLAWKLHTIEQER